MQELAAILRKKRMKRGSIDFDFPETKIVLDDKGKPVEIKPYERNVATKIIEDFMLIANETVAQDYFWQELPFVYRTHDNPDTEKSRSYRHLSIILVILSISDRTKCIRKNCRSCCKDRWNAGGSTDQPADTAFHEAGKVYDHEHRSFWTGNTLLLSFYITDPQIPGSADPSYHQGQSARTDECKENRAL